MTKTKHMHVRMNQRGIDQELVDLVAKFGSISDAGSANRISLGRKGIDAALQRLDRLRVGLLRLRDKGGAVLVQGHDGADITTYRIH
jgi:hypothetical protein